MCCSEKLVLDDEKAKVEAEARACADEMMSLRQELDTVLNAVKQLEAQKTEAQKRLSEIDAKVFLFNRIIFRRTFRRPISRCSIIIADHLQLSF